jgi:4-amino-4-deoxy-L-arabinose transferase-like glycosyltransferase
VAGIRRRGDENHAVKREVLAACGLLALCGALFFVGLGDLPLFDVDEAVFAETTREMIETGDWITPRYNGADRFDKPILFYWLMAGAYAVFGVGEWSARFWSAALGVGLVAVLALFARSRLGSRAGLLSGLVAATSIEVIVLAHSAITDMTLIFFITGGLLSGYTAVQADDAVKRTRWAVLGAASLGLAVLTKGPVGIVIPGLIVVLFLAVRGGAWGTLSRLPWWRMAAVFLVIVAPWYLLELQARGWAFVEGFFLKHNVRRFTGVISGHAGPFYYYVPVVAVGFFPWTALLMPAMRWAWPSGWRGLRRPTDREALGLFLLIWVGTVFVFFSLAGTKLPNYVAALFPPLALLVGAWADRFVARAAGSDRWVTVGIGVLVVVALALAVALGGLPWWVEWARIRFPKAAYLHQPIDVGSGPAWLAVAAVGGALAIAGLMATGRRAAALAGIALTTAAMTVLLVTRVAPVAADVMQIPLRDLAIRAGRDAGADGAVAVYGLNKPSVVFYARRLVTVVGESRPEELVALLAQDRVWYVITKATWMDRLGRIASLHTLDARGGYVLASNRPPATRDVDSAVR